MAAFAKVACAALVMSMDGALASEPPVTPAGSIMCASYASAPTAVTTQPRLASPQDIAVDGIGDVFVVDSVRADLIQIKAVTHKSTVLLGKPILEIPVGLAISPTHADLYVGDENTSTIWHLPCQTRASANCSLYHKTPLNLTLPQAVHPVGLQVDGDEHLYIADFNNQHVWKRDVLTGQLHSILSKSNMGDDAPAKFGPHDIAIDRDTYQLLITDVTNDDIWALKCDKVSQSGLSCDQYDPTPFKLPLTGTDIESPSGIVVDLQSTIYVTGMKNGVVAEIKANHSTDLLAAASSSLLKDPVSLGYDERAVSKMLYISDDPGASTDSNMGLWGLPCSEFQCVGLDARFVKNVYHGDCAGTAVGHSCPLRCAPGFSSAVSSITCTSEGWSTHGISCVPPPNSTSTSSPAAVVTDDGVGVAIGITLAVLFVAAIGVFMVMRWKQGRLVVKTTTYGSYGN